MCKWRIVRTWMAILVVSGVLLSLLSAFVFPPPLAFSFYGPPLNAAQTPAEPLWGPYLTATTSSGTVINARTGLASSATVEYATESYYTAHGSYNWSATDGVSAVMHHISLTGLGPGTAYRYRLIVDGTPTGDYRFRTFPASSPFTFVVYGDTQDELPDFSQYERYKLVADRVAAEPGVAFILHVGDAVNDGSSLDDWNRYFDVGRQLMAGTTVYPALGNHEKNSPLYYDAFGLPSYYSFDCAEAHFTVLDSINDSPEETGWLDSDLDSPKTWKFVSFHYPVYTSDPGHYGGWANLKEEWENILISHGVSAVWNGHIHNYERYLENGIQYIVIGTGGGPMSQIGETRYDGYQNSLENSLAYARVTVSPEAGRATVQIIRVADISPAIPPVITEYPPGTVYDTFVLTRPPVARPGWDLNNDHICDSGDLAILGQRWGQTGIKGWVPEDLNNDGAVNVGDLVVIGRSWGCTW